MTLRPELGDLPLRLRGLPLDRGYPVPWFVAWSDGRPEFRAADPQKFARAIREKRCWVCGQPLGKFLAFVIGPMCAINRTSSEPPCHHECAVWSAQHCPFLSRPHMVRREDAISEAAFAGDAAIPRNPGVAGIWTTLTYHVFKAPRDAAMGYLIRMGNAERVEWFAEGRPATRAEVLASIDSGIPLLLEATEREATTADKHAALEELQRARRAIDRLLPAA